MCVCVCVCVCGYVCESDGYVCVCVSMCMCEDVRECVHESERG